MKEFLVGFISIFLSGVLTEKVTGFLGFEYNLFTEEFNLLLLIADMGIFVGLFVPIHYGVKRLVVGFK